MDLLDFVPVARNKTPGISASASPKPRLNQPRVCASVSAGAGSRLAGTEWHTLFMTSLLRFKYDFDATVCLVAEGPVHVRSVVESNFVRDHERWIDLAILYKVQQLAGPAIHMGLSGAHGQSLVHERAERNLIHQSAVDAGYG